MPPSFLSLFLPLPLPLPVHAFFGGRNDNWDNQPPKAIIGPRTQFESNQVQSVASAMGILHMSTGIPHRILFAGPSTTGLNFNVRNRDYGLYILQYLQSIQGCQHLALLVQREGPMLETVTQTLIDNASNYDINLKVFYTDDDNNNNNKNNNMEDLNTDDDAADVLISTKNSGIKIIMIIETSSTNYITRANILDEMGMLTDDYLYILCRSGISPANVREDFGYVQVNSSIDKLLRGSLVIDIAEPYAWNDDDPLLQSWREQDELFVQTANILVPKSTTDNDNKPYIQATKDFFIQHRPARDSSLVYDAVIAAGIEACGMMRKENKDEATNTTTEQVEEGTCSRSSSCGVEDEPGSYVMGTKFHGASGFVSFSHSRNIQRRRSRAPEGLPIGGFNIRPSTIDANETSHRYEAIMVALTDENGIFQPIDNEVFIYSDGTTNPPAVQLEIINQNFLPRWVQGLGLLLLVTAWVLNITCFVGIYIRRKKQHVRDAQPFFLCLLCIGSLIQSAAIFTLSWDGRTGWSDRQLDIACTISPWLFFLGQILSFSALFTKLMRVDRVLQFRRNQVVLVSNVFRPLLVLQLFTLGILSVWTAIDPWTWETEIIEDAVPSESYSRCSNNSLWPYFGPLFGLLAMSNCLAVYWALKTSEVPEFLSETKGVIIVTLQQSQAWFAGVPILAVLGDSSATAVYLCRVTLIWLFAVLPVVYLVAPKLIHWRVDTTSRGQGRVRISQPGTRR